ncbi:transferase [Deinococcus cellulosilyticus NBRC 106333 = KACC 11606]|uniref:Transferase n=1 Tax=Deinococcus cellulosilyticus (strain DSM 18568 / NBRC 106333 / KACC 11606 / 5516J-15) TaxID=1223518 RepID=A0A511N595_DEIC1|nr:transferase [Deinococcus cellulosilyticus NBRC 106333 = KACC 11606]
MIVGAGGFGREVYAWVMQTPEFVEQHDIKQIAFVDNNLKATEGYGEYPSVIGGVEEFQPGRDDVLLCAVGNPFIRQKLVETLKARGGRFVTFVHRSAIIGLHNVLGEGSIVCPNSVLTVNITVGQFVILNVGSLLGHDVQIGDFVTLSPHCDLTGGVHVGSFCQFGTGVRVIPGIKIAEDVKVGAGSVVIRNVEARTAVFGFPAKKIPRRS